LSHEPNTFIVSNRLPVTVKRQADGSLDFTKSTGGLVSGLADVHARAGALWIGHAGIYADLDDFAATREALAARRYVAVPLTEEEYQAYYSGMSNGTLWPLFHYFLGDTHFDPAFWRAYVQVNRQFAASVLALARPGDRVWVHDYQLMLVPGMLRAAMPTLEIAYFHHIPFPSVELFRILPGRREVLEGLLGADLIGMHTLDYVMHFQTCVTRLLGVDIEREHIRYHGRVVRLGAFPLGVDAQSIRACVHGLSAEGRIAELARVAQGQKVFIGIDRLDYTKGIPEKLRAFQLFLGENPELVGTVVFVQVCVPSREEVPRYSELRAEVERLVGQINGEFSRPGYVPLHYLHQPFSAEEVRQFYKLGDIALVTPLRDGLNLVCKEYVASRDNEDGILILSEFAGAAAEMGEALLVNPFDVPSLAQTMAAAVKMSQAERRRRMRRLRSRIAMNDNLQWSREFMKAWADAPLGAQARHSRKLEGRRTNELVRRLLRQPRRYLFLDYDGTLVPIQRNPSLALPSVATLRLLARLGQLPGVELAIITGRSRDFCEQYFANLPVSIVAEHNGFLRLRGAHHWEETGDTRELEKVKADVLPHLASYVSRIPGAMIEEKATALVLHYREADSVFAHQQAYDLKESLSRILANTPYSAFQAKRAIEVKPVSANKGAAVGRLLDLWGHTGDGDFLTAGDDHTDEDMFLVEPEHNLSIFVGHAHSMARFHVETPQDLGHVLEVAANRLTQTRSLVPQDQGSRQKEGQIP